MSDTRPHLYSKVLKRRRHLKPRTWTYILLLFSVLEAVQASNDWPRYKHPDSSTQECYKCPPGFYKEKDCALTRDKSVQSPMCRPCPDSQYSQRWNTDGRCWDHEFCEKNHDAVYDGGKTGPVKCACNASSLEDEDGFCVAGITSSKHLAVLNQLRISCDARLKSATRIVAVTQAKSTTTQSPCTIAKETPASCAVCAVCEDACEGLPAAAGIAIGWVLGIVTALLVWKIRNICIGAKVKQACEQKKNDHSQLNGAVGYVTGRQQNPSSQDQGHEESVSSREVSHSEDSEIGTPNTPTHVLIPVNEPQTEERTRTSRPNSHHDDKVDKPLGTDLVNIIDEVQGNEAKATPAVTNQQKQRQKLLDDALRIMEKEVTKRTVAAFVIRHVLGLSAKECDGIQDKNLTSDGVLRAGFRRWEERKGSEEATVENLLSALLKHDHRMMAERINGELKLNLKLERQHDESDEFDEVIKICEKILDVDDKVVEFFRSYLELGDKVTQVDKKTFIREGLQKWQDKNGKNATTEKLIQLFIDADMKNEADGIRDELNRQNLGAVSNFEPAGNVSNSATPFATNGGGPSGLSASNSRPRPRSIASDTQGNSTSTQTRDTRNSRRNRTVRGASEEAARPHSLGNLTADVRMESGTTKEPPSTSYPPGHTQGQGDLVSECERVKNADDSTPIEHIEVEDENSGIDGKSARDTQDDMQSLAKGDTNALKPGTDELTDRKPNTKPKETSESDPLLETLTENDKNKNKKKKRRIQEAHV